MFAIGLAAPIALLRDTGHGVLRRLLVASLWIGCLFLLARGTSGLIDDAVRDLGISSSGITGLSYQDILGTAHPSTYTLISGDIIDGYFSSAEFSTAGPPGHVSSVDRFPRQPTAT
jgi:hypothetical protein